MTGQDQASSRASIPSPLVPRPSPLLRDRCVPIEVLILDVDGVLTDGRIIYDDRGVEQKAFYVRDGSGLKIWQLAGKRAAIVTGRSSRAVEVRAAELGIQPVWQGAADKLAAYRQILASGPWHPEQACCIGDDIPDLPLLNHSGLAVAVADACPEAQASAHYVTRAPGGRGAVRETIELILQCQERWQPIVDRFRQ